MALNVRGFMNRREPTSGRRRRFHAFHNVALSALAWQAARGAAEHETGVSCWTRVHGSLIQRHPFPRPAAQPGQPWQPLCHTQGGACDRLRSPVHAPTPHAGCRRSRTAGTRVRVGWQGTHTFALTQGWKRYRVRVMVHVPRPQHCSGASAREHRVPSQVVEGDGDTRPPRGVVTRPSAVPGPGDAHHRETPQAFQVRAQHALGWWGAMLVSGDPRSMHRQRGIGAARTRYARERPTRRTRARVERTAKRENRGRAAVPRWTRVLQLTCDVSRTAGSRPSGRRRRFRASHNLPLS